MKGHLMGIKFAIRLSPLASRGTGELDSGVPGGPLGRHVREDSAGAPGWRQGACRERVQWALCPALATLSCG